MDKQFQEFSDTLFKTYLDLNPMSGTYIGLHEYDGKTGDVTQEGLDSEAEVYRDFYKRLGAIDRSKLSDINKYEYDVAKWAIESELFELEEIKSYKINPRAYVSMFSGLDNYVKRDYAPFDERLRSIINVMDKIPVTLEAAKKNLGTSMTAIFSRFAKHSASGFEEFFKNKFYNEIKERTKDENLLAQYNEKSIAAIEAFKKFSEHIDKINSDTDESYRLGKEKFLKMLRVKEHIDLPLETLKKMGTDELTRLQTELNKIISENNFEGKLETLEHDHPSEENLVQETKDMLAELVQFIRDNKIVDLPDHLNCIVTEMPKYDDFGFAAMGTAGPFEKSDESFYYVNLPNKEWDAKKREDWMTQFNYPILKLISIHEAYPGHYTHFLSANKNSTNLSKLFMSYSYIEGWAHYTEEMMIEQGYSKDNFKVKIGMLLEALIRCCRYIAAIGIHCENMSIEDAKNFFLKNAYMTETTAMQEAERGTFDPGYLNYTLGKLFLYKFRAKYFDKFGKEKSLKDFHDQIISLGAPTYRIAEDYILS